MRRSNIFALFVCSHLASNNRKTETRTKKDKRDEATWDETKRENRVKEGEIIETEMKLSRFV